MKATFYKRPNGQAEEIEIKQVNPEDAAWFEANNIKISLESDGSDGAIMYADIGLRTRDGEPIEMIEISSERNCNDTLAALRKQCEEAKS